MYRYYSFFFFNICCIIFFSVVKARLIKEGKIKKEKPLPEITADEVPFDIPDNWKWVRLGSIIYNRGQKTPDADFTYIDIEEPSKETEE